MRYILDSCGRYCDWLAEDWVMYLVYPSSIVCHGFMHHLGTNVGRTSEAVHALFWKIVC